MLVTHGQPHLITRGSSSLLYRSPGYFDMLYNQSLVRIMVLNATFNNISDIQWRTVLLVEETSVPGEIHRPVASHRQTLSHNVVSSTPRHELGLNSQLLVVLGTDCIGSYKSNYMYHAITTTTTTCKIQILRKIIYSFTYRVKNYVKL